MRKEQEAQSVKDQCEKEIRIEQETRSRHNAEEQARLQSEELRRKDEETQNQGKSIREDATRKDQQRTMGKVQREVQRYESKFATGIVNKPETYDLAGEETGNISEEGKPSQNQRKKKKKRRRTSNEPPKRNMKWSWRSKTTGKEDSKLLNERSWQSDSPIRPEEAVQWMSSQGDERHLEEHMQIDAHKESCNAE